MSGSVREGGRRSLASNGAGAGSNYRMGSLSKVRDNRFVNLSQRLGLVTTSLRI